MNFVGRRTFLGQLSLASAAMALPLYGFSGGSKPDEFVEVDTTYGRIKGGRNECVVGGPPRDGSAPKESFFGGNRPERFTASRHFAELWTTFARTGTPAANDVPVWPAYNLKSRPTMRIDATCTVIDNRFGEELAMWRSLGKL